MNFDPFTTFNYNSTNENKAFEETLELLIVLWGLICSGWGHTWITLSWGYSLVKIILGNATNSILDADLISYKGKKLVSCYFHIVSFELKYAKVLPRNNGCRDTIVIFGCKGNDGCIGIAMWTTGWGICMNKHLIRTNQ